MSVLDVINLQNNGPYLPNNNLKESERVFAKYRTKYDFAPDGKTKLIKLGGNQKIGEEVGTLSLLAGAEADMGMCVNSAVCEPICVVNESVRGQWDTVRRARKSFTDFLISEPTHFAALFERDLEWLNRRGVEYVRPNVNSDVAWEKVFPWMTKHPVKFYDYTKVLSRVSKNGGQILDNYRVTYSATSQTREALVKRLINNGTAVTMVFPVKKGNIPENHLGIDVIDGDPTDIRYHDSGVIVGLSAKGKLKGKKFHPLITNIVGE